MSFYLSIDGANILFMDAGYLHHAVRELLNVCKWLNPFYLWIFCMYLLHAVHELLCVVSSSPRPDQPLESLPPDQNQIKSDAF